MPKKAPLAEPSAEKPLAGPLAKSIGQKTGSGPGSSLNFEASLSFEASLGELEKIVARLESGVLPLEEALDEFERGVQLARLGQQRLKQAEQRVHILLHDDPDAPLSPFVPDNSLYPETK